MHLQWCDKKCPQWCLGDEWDEVSKSNQLIYISSGLKTYLTFPTTASACTDWSMWGLCMSLHLGWICVCQSCVLRTCVQVTSLLIFYRKDLCEAKHEMQSVFKFSDVLFALKSDGPPSRGILWPRVVLTWVQLTWGQMYPLVEASCGQEWYYIRSAWHFVSLRSGWPSDYP